jgi:hypothetical protein
MSPEFRGASSDLGFSSAGTKTPNICVQLQLLSAICVQVQLLSAVWVGVRGLS